MTTPGDSLPTVRTSEYARMHQVEGIGARYDEVIYRDGGYDAFVWSRQRPILEDVMRRQRATIGQLRALDFACGTGRILSVVDRLADDVTGVDISRFMIEQARPKVAHARLLVADVLDQPDAIGPAYDLITAFRFFLNTEDRMRARIMALLAGRLAGPEARLVFNIHANQHSMSGVAGLYRSVRGWEPGRFMTYRQVRRLLEDAGLRVEACHGFGILPPRLHRGPGSGLARAIDRRTAGRGLFRPVCRDLLFVCRPA